ncbi:MAG: aspartate-semialdehyde dehydrogenase [Deltaproteobacteria bacterium]|nr:aspartate-semialdehyde dehydrogenase [Deltaproteobacteria bacterium]MBW2396328.1 aspartate-semialdehyde dehydrogenase [Deltaproteobacteria bacterium]
MADRQPNDPRTVAVVGATGAVGEVVLRLLAERNFPVGELRALASERSAGSTVVFDGQDIIVQEACPESFDGVDFAFFAATGSLSKTLAPEVAKRGGVAIDKSNTWRLNDEVPLVVPEINPDALEKHKGIVSCPNCTTIGFVMALEPLRREAGVKSVVVTTLQAVSGSGKPGLEELARQTAEVDRGEAPTPSFYPQPIVGNALPLCEDFREDGYSTEEIKLLNETRKIMGVPDLDVTMTCVRVPVPVGHSATMLIETERALSPERAREVLSAFPGVEVIDDPSANVFPTARDVTGRDEVLVGRVRKDLASDRLWLWQVSDNLRKGAATNAIQIAEEMVRRGLK